MDTNQPTNPVTPPPSTPTTTYVPAAAASGMFGTKIPSTVAFAIAVLLFLLPFIDIKCNGASLQTISGVQLATGFQMKNSSSNNSLLNEFKTDKVDEGITTATTKSNKKDPNLYALIALGLGVLGLILTFANAKPAMGGAMIVGIAGAAALIGMMLDIKKKVKLDMPDSGGNGGDIGKGLDNITSTMSDKMNITVDFTPWFYIAVIAFLAGAFFCFKRMSVSKK